MINEFKNYLEENDRYKRISFLVKANGGFEVYSWGYISYLDGHQHGLEQNDAIALIQWKAYFDGVSDWSINAYDVFKPYYDKYLEELEESR